MRVNNQSTRERGGVEQGGGTLDDRDKEKVVLCVERNAGGSGRAGPPDASQRMRLEQAIITIIAI